MSEDEISNEFRMIISHAFLGSDTSDIDKETWEMMLDGCTKFAMQLINEKPTNNERTTNRAMV